MTALIIGIAAILFAVLAVLPAGFGWWQDVLLFLRGAIPVMALFIGLIAIFIGIADIKDRIEAKREEEEERKAEENSKKE
jgi:hypothetical protein